MDRPSQALSGAERALLLIPLAGGAVFGLLPFLVPTQFATATGYVGDDPYIARLAGSATFGYAIALAVGIRSGRWDALRNVVVAVLAFNVVSLGACFFEIALGRAQPVVYLIAVTSALIIGITWSILRRHGATPQGPRDVATWVVGLLVLATVAATAFGVFPQFPKFVADLGGYNGTDKFLYRQAGAATFGYAAMGLFELRSLRWEEMRLPSVMALVFNALAFIASAVELASRVTLLAALVAPASLVFTVGIALALVRRGR